MKKVIVAVILALALAACATGPKIGASRLDVIEATYGSAYAIAVGYRDSCEQRLIPPSCRLVVPKLQNAAKDAQGELIKARDFVDRYPTLDATAAIALANSAVGSFSNLARKYKVK